MDTARLDALQALLDGAWRCFRFCMELRRLDGYFSDLRRYSTIGYYQWQNVRRGLDGKTERLASAKREFLRLTESAPDLLPLMEDANIEHARPVRFRHFDFTTATEAAPFIAEAMIEDCRPILSWPDYPHLADLEKLNDLRRLRKLWKLELSEDKLRQLAKQSELECRRAMRQAEAETDAHLHEKTDDPPLPTNGQSDTKPDNSKNSEIRLPKNPDVRDLIAKLQEDLPKGKRKIDIAREFTNENPDNDKKAQLLLRQVSRFPELLPRTGQ